MWFNTLTGFDEHQTDDVAARFTIEGSQIVSSTNGHKMQAGRFETVTLQDLRHRLLDEPPRSGTLSLRELVADVQALHLDPANAGALFQVASQFNTLEMVSPTVTPEDGIDSYEHDHTQGPACAVACGAGTIYRNYLVPLDDAVGQTADRQIDCLADLTAQLGVEIDMQNGYALPTPSQLKTITADIDQLDQVDRDELMGLLRIGMQWDTEVTLDDAGHLVTQAYCSAVPISYSTSSAQSWEPLARLVLDAAYEATFLAAALNAEATGNRTLFLTLLGGGVFGNPTSWILSSVERAATLCTEFDLDVAIVSYGSSRPELHDLLARYH